MLQGGSISLYLGLHFESAVSMCKRRNALVNVSAVKWVDPQAKPLYQKYSLH